MYVIATQDVANQFECNHKIAVLKGITTQPKRARTQFCGTDSNSYTLHRKK